MRLISRAAVAAFLFAIPVAVFGQVGSLYISDYQLISSSPAGSPTLWEMTYRASVVNGAIPWGSVTATVGTLNPVVVRIPPGLNTLNFPAVPANSAVASTNTFSVLANPNVPLNPSNLVWTFHTTPQAPIANAGPGQTVAIGAHVTVNGSASTNPSAAGTLTYQWAFSSRPPGSQTRLTSSVGVQSGFTVDVAGNYVLTLTVSNGIASSSSSVTISTANTPPVANAGPNQFVNIGALVQLNGTGSTDVDGNPLGYHWSFVSMPPNSTATLSDPNALLPSFTADLPGAYQIQLIVDDGVSDSAPSIVTVTTNPPTVPTAFAGQNRTVGHNVTITLEGVGVDPQGKPLFYTWTLLSKPVSSIATISNPSIPQPTMFVDKPGTYVAQLVVSNGIQTSTASTVTITTTNTPPVASAGTDLNGLVGRAVLLDGSGTFDADNDTLVYKWTFLHFPTGSGATISGAGGVFPNFTPDLPGIYVVQLIASDPYSSSAPATVTITVTAPVVITLTPTTLAISPSPGSLTVNLSSPAGPNGAVINLNSSNTAAATVPPTVTVSASQSTATFTVTPGTASGATTITASAPGMNSGTATVNYTRPAAMILSANPVNVNMGGQAAFPVNFSIPAPTPTGVVITLSSSDTTKVKLPNPIVTIPPGATAPVPQPLITGVTLGSATITATSPGYPTVSQAVNVVETASFYPSTVTLPFISSLRYSWLMLPVPAPAGGLTLNLKSDNPAIATVPATIKIPAGYTEVQVNVTGVSKGTTTIHASLLPSIPDTTATVNVAQ